MWVLSGEGKGYKKWNCSNCNLLVRNSQKPWYKFCPNCGADNRKEREDIEVVIKIPEHYYENNIKKELPIYLSEDNIVAILPKGHGRLIDADDYKKTVCTYQQTGCGDCKHSSCCPEDVPTIIEADKAESEEEK